MNILDILGKKPVFYDGATGTYLQANGLKAGEKPELMNINNPEVLIKMHQNFIEAGSNIILTNTFGANRFKFSSDKLEEIIENAIKNAKKARELSGKHVFISYDMGPTGKLLEPMGDLTLEQTYDVYQEQVLLCNKYGVDMVTIETMSDLYETKAAILAVKENSDLPLFVTTTFDESGKLLTGADVKTMVAVLEGLGVDALGVNCGTGPYQLHDVVCELLKYASIPVIVNPNAGLPRKQGNTTVFDINADEFAVKMLEYANMGVAVLGGCCGTTSEHINKTYITCKDVVLKPTEQKNYTIATSYAKSVVIAENPTIIGECINPTGKQDFIDALEDGDLDEILDIAIEQQDCGAHILDVNISIPNIDEVQTLSDTIKELQSTTTLPLQIDTINVQAMEQALRIYNGKPIINSVNGTQKSMDTIFPLAQKYGGVIIAMTFNEDGIPETAEKRYEIAKNIINEAKKYNINEKDIIIDTLVTPIATNQNCAKITLDALKLIKQNLNVKTILGISNISFGMPKRKKINASFLTLALYNGLDCAILNPLSQMTMDCIKTCSLLCGLDSDCLDFIQD